MSAALRPGPEAPDRPEASPAGDDGALRRLRRVARIMDDAVEIPLLGVRIGLDPVLGLLPGAGDVLGAAVGGWIVVKAARLGAAPSVVARMLLNLGVDALVGAAPLLGDLFDVAFKANRRNLGILEEHVLDPTATLRRSRTVVWGAVGGVLTLLGGLVAAVLWGLTALLGVVA